MPTRYGRQCVIALSAATLLVACKPKESATNDTSSAAGAVATGSDSANKARTDSAAAVASSGGWTDGQIIAFVGVANKAEIAEGKIATTKATNAKVKSFAHVMVTDHTALLTEGNAFAKKNNITPDSTKSDIVDLQKDALDEMKDLQTKAKGADWDKNFIDKEIDGHKKVLDKLQQAEKATTNPQLKDMLMKATAKVQDHLTKAQAIKDSVLKS